MTGGIALARSEAPCNVDVFYDTIKSKSKSLKKNFAFFDISTEFKSVSDEIIDKIELSLRKFRSSKSAKSKLIFRSDRWIWVKFWEDELVGWKYNLDFNGRLSPDVTCSDLLVNFIKTGERLRLSTGNEEDIRRIWSKILLSGPGRIIG